MANYTNFEALVEAKLVLLMWENGAISRGEAIVELFEILGCVDLSGIQADVQKLARAEMRAEQHRKRVEASKAELCRTWWRRLLPFRVHITRS